MKSSFGVAAARFDGAEAAGGATATVFSQPQRKIPTQTTTARRAETIGRSTPWRLVRCNPVRSAARERQPMVPQFEYGMLPRLLLSSHSLDSPAPVPSSSADTVAVPPCAGAVAKVQLTAS